MAYQEITCNKTVELSSDASTVTLIYYAGNKNTSTGSFIGNAKKHDIRTVIPSTVTWVTNAELSLKDDTAYNIKITYTANNTDTNRSCSLKLSNSKTKESSYTIILSQAKKESTSVNYTITWDFTIINNSNTAIPHCTLHFLLMNFPGGVLYNNNTEMGIDTQEAVPPFSTGQCVSNSYTQSLTSLPTEGQYTITPHTFSVRSSLYTKEVDTNISGCTFWSGGQLINSSNSDFTLYVSSSSYITINNDAKTISISLQILDKQQ